MDTKGSELIYPNELFHYTTKTFTQLSLLKYGEINLLLLALS